MAKDRDDFVVIDPMVLLDPRIVGTLIEGRVVNVASFGLFVELRVCESIIDGLLRFEQTPHPEAARRYQLGDRIKVVITAVDPVKCKIGLALPEELSAYGWSAEPPQEREG